MRILIVSLFFPPEPVSRPFEISQIFNDEKFDVFIVTAFPNYPEGKVYKDYKMGLPKWYKLNDISILRIPHIIDRSKSVVKRILSFLSFSISTFLSSILLMKKPDLIWTYQIGLPGYFLSKIWKVPLIHEVQDLWPDWGRSAGVGLKSFLYKILETQENIIYNHASSIVTITHKFKQILTTRVKDPEKIVVIPNWANDKFLEKTAKSPLNISEDIFAGFFNILYVGNIGTAQGLKFLIQAASLLKEVSEIRITIIGDGVEKVIMEKEANELGLKNINFLGSLPQEEASNYMKVADVLFIHLRDDPIYEITIPSKTFGYLAAKRPILAAAKGELADLINDNHVGVVCPPEDPQAIANAILELKNLPKEELDRLGLAGYELVKNNFTREILGKKYINLFEDIIVKGKGRKS